MPTTPPQVAGSMLLLLCAVALTCRAGEPGAEPPVPPVVPPPDRPTPAAPAAEQGPSVPEAPTWAGSARGDRERRKLKSQSDQEWGFVATEIIWRAPDPGHDSPFERGEWSTEDLFAVPVSGPLHLFTEVSLGGEYAADQAMKVVGKTGFLWKMAIGEGAPVEVRGGPTVKYNDALNPVRGKEQAAMLWEVKAKTPLVGPLGLEYLGEAMPGTTPEEHAQLKQNLNLYLPISGGKLKLGAKHKWDVGQQEARTTGGLMELYLGIEIGR